AGRALPRAARAGSPGGSRPRAASGAAPPPAPSTRGGRRTRRLRSGAPDRATPGARAACPPFAPPCRAAPRRQGTPRGPAADAGGQASRPACGRDRPRRARRAARIRAPPSPGGQARRDLGGADRTTRRRGRPSGELELLVAHLDPRAALRACCAERSLELLVGRRLPEHAEASLGPEEAPRPGLRLRAIDEEVGELVVGALERLGLGHQREQAAAELVEPGTG